MSKGQKEVLKGDPTGQLWNNWSIKTNQKQCGQLKNDLQAHPGSNAWTCGCSFSMAKGILKMWWRSGRIDWWVQMVSPGRSKSETLGDVTIGSRKQLGIGRWDAVLLALKMEECEECKQPCPRTCRSPVDHIDSLWLISERVRISVLYLTCEWFSASRAN